MAGSENVDTIQSSYFENVQTSYNINTFNEYTIDPLINLTKPYYNQAEKQFTRQTSQYKNGGVIKDDRGQWDHPGEITEIGSNQITMQGVPYPVLGISDTGDTQMMYPNQEYEFIGDSVTEYPMMKQGGQLTKLDQLSNFTNYNTKQPGSWLDKYQ